MLFCHSENTIPKRIWACQGRFALLPAYCLDYN